MEYLSLPSKICIRILQKGLDPDPQHWMYVNNVLNSVWVGEVELTASEGRSLNALIKMLQAGLGIKYHVFSWQFLFFCGCGYRIEYPT